MVCTVVGYRSHNVALTQQEAEKMSHITHPLSFMVPRGIQTLLYRLDYSNLQGSHWVRETLDI